MGDAPELRTERLLMRRWCDRDRQPFAAINTDPVVMEFFPARRSREQSDDSIDRYELHFEIYGFGPWALEVVDSGEFIGFTGLSNVGFTADFTPAVNVDWRLARHAWGQGYATEAGRAALEFGFTEVGLTEVVAMAAAANRRSQAVMRRLGMRRDTTADFTNPDLGAGHPFASHVLYRLSRPERGAR
ncbi:GNAT family N-acetyltransferase [Nocardiopsis ansamitocini]|uniref:N-acetyltransferase n=1 Tax=Nocardiopsis ansamitocini TaxID=1670832 RepID=A0A9W6P789_9ACTN|nr:GNAT family N-acetyltransferase [Nocardiopsis ansamitocini]GLU48416.1 N-acetyltransferase [Nocardiopsis ansamitocini]